MADPESRLWEYRKDIALIDAQESRDRDKAILTLSGGALVLSTTFLSAVFEEPRQVWLLSVAWILLATSLVSVLFAYETSRSERRVHLQEIDTQLRNPMKPAPLVDTKRTRRLNRLALWSLVIGLVLLSTFASINLWSTT